MVPSSIDSPSTAWWAGRGPERLRMAASMLLDVGERCRTTATAAGRSGGNWATRRRRLSTPPADAPITTRLPLSTKFLLVAVIRLRAYSLGVSSTSLGLVAQRGAR